MSEVEARKEAVRKSLAKASTSMMSMGVHALVSLKETIKKREWFEGLILSTTFFEMFGSIMLNLYFGQGKKGSEQHNIVAHFLDRLPAMKVIHLLYLFSLIELGNYSKMKDVVKERNEWVHRVKMGSVYLVDVEQKDIEKIMELIEDAIDCLKELGVRD